MPRSIRNRGAPTNYSHQHSLDPGLVTRPNLCPSQHKRMVPEFVLQALATLLAALLRWCEETLDARRRTPRQIPNQETRPETTSEGYQTPETENQPGPAGPATTQDRVPSAEELEVYADSTTIGPDTPRTTRPTTPDLSGEFDPQNLPGINCFVGNCTQEYIHEQRNNYPRHCRTHCTTLCQFLRNDPTSPKGKRHQKWKEANPEKYRKERGL